jgi:hypothetical protein
MNIRKHWIAAVVAATLAIPGAALADKPAWAGGNGMVVDAMEDLLR